VLAASRAVKLIMLGEDAGFFPIDLGDLVTGCSLQQMGGPLSGQNLVGLPPPGS
jgi:hypothetical protein